MDWLWFLAGGEGSEEVQRAVPDNVREREGEREASGGIQLRAEGAPEHVGISPERHHAATSRGSSLPARGGRARHALLRGARAVLQGVLVRRGCESTQVGWIPQFPHLHDPYALFPCFHSSPLLSRASVKIMLGVHHILFYHVPSVSVTFSSFHKFCRRWYSRLYGSSLGRRAEESLVLNDCLTSRTFAEDLSLYNFLI